MKTKIQVSFLLTMVLFLTPFLAYSQDTNPCIPDGGVPTDQIIGFAPWVHDGGGEIEIYAVLLRPNSRDKLAVAIPSEAEGGTCFSFSAGNFSEVLSDIPLTLIVRRHIFLHSYWFTQYPREGKLSVSRGDSFIVTFPPIGHSIHFRFIKNGEESALPDNASNIYFFGFGTVPS